MGYLSLGLSRRSCRCSFKFQIGKTQKNTNRYIARSIDAKNAKNAKKMDIITDKRESGMALEKGDLPLESGNVLLFLFLRLRYCEEGY